ncbi:MAG: RagB/SusD family nutrient uptake outer membrane protein, partial [Arenibacter algicola]
MKKNIIISLLSISFLGNSCTSDFLDVQPQSSLTTAVFYTTENDFDQAIAAAYNQLQGIYDNGNQYQQIVEGRSDDETAFNYWVLEYGKFLDTDFSNGVSWIWSSFFKTIATTNAVITEIEGKDLANKERVLGEAHFIRGLCYMELARFFGGVPLYDGRRSTDEYKTIPRSTLEETYSFIYADLNTAITNLPASYDGSDIGRATSGAAKGFLARAYLYNNDYTNCLATCNSITGYQFFTDWSQIFNEDNDNGPQALFQLQYTSGGIGEGSALQTNLMEANARVVNGRTMQYSGSSLVPVVSNDFINSFEPGDSRFDLSLALTNE